MLTEAQISELQKSLDWSRVRERPGAGGQKYAYLEGFDVIDRANEIFGFSEWGYETVSNDYQQIVDISTGEVIGGQYVARVRLEVTGCMPVTEEGACALGATKGKGLLADHDKARKGAITDALKRCFRKYGPQFGNSLYDTQVINQQKADSQARERRQAESRSGIQPESAPAPSCKDCKAPLETFKDSEGKLYTVQTLATNSERRYGRILCTSCVRKIRQTA